MVTEPNPTALSKTMVAALGSTESFSEKEAFEVLKEEKSWHRFCKLFSTTFIKK